MTKRLATTKTPATSHWLAPFVLACVCGCTNSGLEHPAHPGPAEGNRVRGQPGHAHDHVGHEEHGASRATVLADGVRASFKAMETSAHLAMAAQMGIQWKPDPEADYHLSVTLTGAEDPQPMRDLSVLLSITDPGGHLTQKEAQVMSAGAMYHYGIDFKRTVAGVYRARAAFELNGQSHTLEADLSVDGPRSASADTSREDKFRVQRQSCNTGSAE